MTASIEQGACRNRYRRIRTPVPDTSSGIRPEVPEGQHWRGPLSPDGYPVLYPKVSGFLRFAPSSYGMCAPRAVLRLLRTIVALLHAVLRASLWPSAATAVAYSPLAWFWAIAYSVHGARAVR
jgi:hypothetical protein